MNPLPNSIKQLYTDGVNTMGKAEYEVSGEEKIGNISYTESSWMKLMR